MREKKPVQLNKEKDSKVADQQYWRTNPRYGLSSPSGDHGDRSHLRRHYAEAIAELGPGIGFKRNVDP